MSFRNLSFLAVTILIAPFVRAQSLNAKPATAAKPWAAPRTPDGRPDLQGVWANNNATPLERPKELAGRAFLTDQELAALKKKAAELFSDGNSDAAFGDQLFATVLANVNGTKSGFTSTDGGTGDYSSVWLSPRDWDNRTSLITAPPDGRLPPRTAEAQQKQAAAAANRSRLPAGPEDRSLSERCITFGAPRLGAAYQSYFQIVQSPKEAVILQETIHDARMVPLDGSPHLPQNIRLWLGDPRGHWEGDTLVVDTTNYKPGAFMNISTEKLHVVEKFTRASPDVLNWEITIDDPGAWSKPWTAMIPLHRSKEFVVEYACHEGNIGLAGILAGARAEERAAKAEPK
ncbi:MAG TPA: hypothetical protein VH639_04825 [Bryobacteraceae bacterium]|jgi:hypothetical protein